MFTLKSLKKIAKSATLVLAAAVVSFGAIEIASPSYADAAAKKKVRFVSQSLNKFGNALERAGRAAQAKRGIMRPVGGILRGAGKGGRHLGRGVSRGMRAVSRGTNRALSRSRVGRGIQRGYRKAQNFQNRGINRAFGRCGGRVCQGARNAVRLFSPL